VPIRSPHPDPVSTDRNLTLARHIARTWKSLLGELSPGEFETVVRAIAEGVAVGRRAEAETAQPARTEAQAES